MGKIIEHGETAQGKILEGVIKTVDAIKTTIGPAGHGVAITSIAGLPEITRDGATVAKSVSFSDDKMNVGAELVKRAATLTEDQAGDGTSTTSLLIKELCLKGQKAVQTGSNVNEIKAGMLKAGKWMHDYIAKNATPIEGNMELLKKVATISANNDEEVGNLVVQGISQVGDSGMVTADVAMGLDTVIDVVPGMKLGRGWSSPQYITEPKTGECIMENANVLVVGEKLTTVNQLYNFLNQYVQQAPGTPLLIVCDSIDDSVNMTLILNVLRGALRACVVQGLDFGDNRKNVMNDLAVKTGATYLCAENGNKVEDANMTSLGSAAKVVISREDTVIYEGGGDPEEIKQLAESLKSRLNDKSCSDYDKMKFEKRVANLTGGIAVIKAGGATEAEKTNRKATIEDSIKAAKSALEEGFVLGGGNLYYKASEQVKKDTAFWKTLKGDEKEGAEIVFKSLPVVLKTIAENSGENGDVILNQTSKKKDGIGYNAKTKKFGNLLNDGVLDSAKVVRVALENSISTASMILLIDCTVVEEKEEVKPAN